MSLAPTLLTVLVVTPLAGAATVAGREVGTDVRYVSPAPAAVVLTAGSVPTIITQEGPTAAPEAAAVIVAASPPTLLRTLIVTPTLNDAPGETNDLTPTLVWGGGAAPDRALVTVGGLSPALLRDGGQTVYPTAGSVLIAPLAPDVTLPAGQIQLREPHRAQLGLADLAPDLLTTVSQSVPAGTVSAAGLAPALVGLRYDWQPVPPAAPAAWTEVPRV